LSSANDLRTRSVQHHSLQDMTSYKLGIISDLVCVRTASISASAMNRFADIRVWTCSRVNSSSKS